MFTTIAQDLTSKWQYLATANHSVLNFDIVCIVWNHWIVEAFEFEWFEWFECQGNPQGFLGIQDSDGQSCGVDIAVKTQPYLYICPDQQTLGRWVEMSWDELKSSESSGSLESLVIWESYVNHDHCDVIWSFDYITFFIFLYLSLSFFIFLYLSFIFHVWCLSCSQSAIQGMNSHHRRQQSVWIFVLQATWLTAVFSQKACCYLCIRRMIITYNISYSYTHAYHLVYVYTYQYHTVCLSIYYIYLSTYLSTYTPIYLDI